MDFDCSWEAVTNPGRAGLYFDIKDPPIFDCRETAYSKINAWWLAELSRLIYRREYDEIGSKARGPTRDIILRKIGLREEYFFNRQETQCAIVGPLTGSDFRILVFRGTSNLWDWLADLNAAPGIWPENGLVHRGFHLALDRVWKEVTACLSSFNGPVFYTGHSLGAALATLAASRKPPTALYSYGSPRVGDKGFALTLSATRVYRLVNNRDIVPTLPPSIGPLAFRHVGELFYITSDSRLLVNPAPETVADCRPTVNILPRIGAARRSWHDPPRFIADHAPVNYVAHLERLLRR